MAKARSCGNTPEIDMKNALYEVIEIGLSLKSVSEKYKIPRTTLRRYRDKCKHNLEQIDFSDRFLEGAPRLTPNYEVNRVFDRDEEQTLTSYLQTMAKLHHGLTPKHVKTMAYELAILHKKKIPSSWSKNKCAGKDWFTGFMRRNKTVSIRIAEATSLGRAMGFNKPVVQRFFSNLKILYEKHNFNPSQVYNVDETALTTVQGSNKIIATKGQKQVGQVTSAERGTLVTMVGAINALGNSVPPMLIFPRKNFKHHMTNNAPPGTKGVASQTGWITSELFKDWMEHFIFHAKPKSDTPVLLVMDNHESHLSLDVIRCAKDNNVILLTLPPHTSHRLQPLDKCVYGPLKRHYNNECQKWLLNHPGRRITIYDISEILSKAYPESFSPKNCISAFKSTGIYPFNDEIFDDSIFLPASVTDVPDMTRPETSTQDHSTLRRADASESIPDQFEPQIAGPSEIRSPSPATLYFSPEAVIPYPKSTTHTTRRKARNKKSTEVLTDTPVFQRLQEEMSLKQAKKVSTVKRQVLQDKDINAKIPKNKKIEISQEESSDEDGKVSYASSTLTEDFDENDVSFETKDIEINSFILVKFATKKSYKYYIGQVREIHPDEEFSVSFLRNNNARFSFPVVPDVSCIRKSDIVMKLPKPTNTGGTIRMSHSYQFSVDLSLYNVL